MNELKAALICFVLWSSIVLAQQPKETLIKPSLSTGRIDKVEPA